MPTKKGIPKLLPLKRQLRSNQTRAEQLLWAKLRHNQIHGLKFLRQHGIGLYIVDFYCPERKLIIEVDGDMHAAEIQQTKNLNRENYLKSLGLQVVRYTNDEIINNLDGVLEDLIQRIFGNSTSPSPSLQKRRKLNRDLSRCSRIATSHEVNAPITKEGNMQGLSKPLPREFYERPTLKVAKDLLGKILVKENANRTSYAKIVDVEAYVGPKDKACHASKGRTKRTEIMFGPAGFTYVYLIYGMHHLLNIVTEREDYPAAILIRGVELFEQDQAQTQQTRIDGPGRVGRFLELNRTHNGLDTTQGTTIWVENHGRHVSKKHIHALPRIGVDYAGEWAKKLWRFCLPTPPPAKRPTKTVS